MDRLFIPKKENNDIIKNIDLPHTLMLNVKKWRS